MHAKAFDPALTSFGALNDPLHRQFLGAFSLNAQRLIGRCPLSRCASLDGWTARAIHPAPAGSSPERKSKNRFTPIPLRSIAVCPSRRYGSAWTAAASLIFAPALSHLRGSVLRAAIALAGACCMACSLSLAPCAEPARSAGADAGRFPGPLLDARDTGQDRATGAGAPLCSWPARAGPSCRKPATGRRSSGPSGRDG